MDKRFDFFERFPRRKRNFIFEQFACGIVELSFEDRKFFYFAAVVQAAHDRCDVVDASFFEQVEVHLVAELPIRRDRFEIVGKQVERFFRFGSGNDGADTEFFGIFNACHDGHIRRFDIDIVIRHHFAVKKPVIDGDDFSDALTGVDDLLIYAESRRFRFF